MSLEWAPTDYLTKKPFSPREMLARIRAVCAAAAARYASGRPEGIGPTAMDGTESEHPALRNRNGQGKGAQ